MRIRMTIATLAAVAALFAFGSSALEAAAPGKGSVEIAPSAAYAYNKLSFRGNDDGAVTGAFVDVLVGYYVTDMIQVGGSVLVEHSSIDPPPGAGATSTRSSFGLDAGVQVNFPASGNVVPFVRAAAGFASNSGSGAFGTESTILAPIVAGGIRWMVGDAGSVNMGVAFRHEINAFGVKDEDANVFRVFVGVSLFPVLGSGS